MYMCGCGCICMYMYICSVCTLFRMFYIDTLKNRFLVDVMRREDHVVETNVHVVNVMCAVRLLIL